MLTLEAPLCKWLFTFQTWNRWHCLTAFQTNKRSISHR